MSSNIVHILNSIGSFDALERMSKFQKLRELVALGADVFERIEKARAELGDTLTADQVEEIRPLMDRIVPRAIAAGRALDAKLEQAKNR